MPLILLILTLLFGVSPDAQIQNILSALNNGCDSQSWRENFVDARAFYGGDVKRNFTGDITGQRFSRLFVVSYFGSVNGFKSWNCICDCGNKVIARAVAMRSGNTGSCGCLGKERRRAARFIKHGHAAWRDGVHKYTREYVSWASMRRRCYYKGDHDYKYYGARGIRVCNRWRNSFSNFLADMGERPQGKTLGRKDSDLNYYPSNCAWETPLEQTLHRKATRFIEADGKRLCLTHWARLMNFSKDVITRRIKNGWTEALAATTPLDKPRPKRKKCQTIL